MALSESTRRRSQSLWGNLTDNLAQCPAPGAGDPEAGEPQSAWEAQGGDACHSGPYVEHPVASLCNKSPDIMGREARQLVMGSETTELVIPHQKNKC